jgi:energy-coupling factor transporter ATP-binding protein EcfA2
VASRVKLRFAGLEVEFADRDRGIRHVYELAEKGTRFPVVVFGPEGCGKTAWLRQATEILKENNFDVIYVDPLRKEYAAYTDVKEVVDRISDVVADVTGYSPVKLVDVVLLLGNILIKRWRRKRVALLVDEVFQSIGIERAEIYTKMLLNLIEHPPGDYEKIVAVVTTSEGVSRGRISRHLWADVRPMWNISKKGFEELYEELPSSKPSFEDVWRLAGGNPRVLELLHQLSWSAEKAVEKIVEVKKLRAFVALLSDDERAWLCEAIENPDTLFTRERMQLLNKLVELNLVVDDVPSRDPDLWVDEPPPEKDPELGIGRYVAWQTPLHREAVKKALQKV